MFRRPIDAKLTRALQPVALYLSKERVYIDLHADWSIASPSQARTPGGVQRREKPLLQHPDSTKRAPFVLNKGLDRIDPAVSSDPFQEVVGFLLN